MTALPLVFALTIVSPQDGAAVELLRPAQREYLAESRKARFVHLDDAAYRRRLVKSGHVQPPVKLVWKDAPEAAVVLTLEDASGKSAFPRQTFALTNLSEVHVTNLELGRRYRWTVASGAETATGGFTTSAMPPRLMRFDGVVNARDLGGWTGRGGRKVRQGRIYRSGGFRGSASSKDKSIFSSRFEAGARDLTDAGVEHLRDDLGIRTDIELRGVMETVCMQDSALGPDVEFVKIPFSAYNFIDNLIRGREPFVRLFRRFTDAESYPIVFHCAGGRDRTGTLSFLLLGLLGVADDDLCRDWESSAFSEDNTEFGSARLERLLGYLQSLGGGTFAEDCEIYAHGCGITDEEIARFREIMLAGEAAE